MAILEALAITLVLIANLLFKVNIALITLFLLSVVYKKVHKKSKRQARNYNAYK